METAETVNNAQADVAQSHPMASAADDELDEHPEENIKADVEFGWWYGKAASSLLFNEVKSNIVS
jgi:hypothetical protein